MRALAFDEVRKRSNGKASGAAAPQPPAEASIPRDRLPDATVSLLRDGYLFISKRCERLGADAFETRLLLRSAICMRGAEAGRIFYEPGRFTRRGAMPPTALQLLQDRGSVAQLDDAAHHHRKAMFLSIVTGPGVEGLLDELERQWIVALKRWQGERKLVLFEEARHVLTSAVCSWVGIPDALRRDRALSRELGAMIDGAGGYGLRNIRGQLLRARTERWARSLIRKARGGDPDIVPGSPLHTVAQHRDTEGKLIETRHAAVELLNLLRPTAAVDRYITFVALALHQHPRYRQQIAGDDRMIVPFVQEVRRFYPFFPFVAGRVIRPFDWRGRHFDEHDWVIFDLYGTNHDPRIWRDPETFRAERFENTYPDPFELVPQGGGDIHVGHRCAGEWLTIELMKRATRLLTRSMRYDVPEQDLSIDLSRMPALPQSRFVIANVRAIG